MTQLKSPAFSAEGRPLSRGTVEAIKVDNDLQHPNPAGSPFGRASL